MTESFLIRPDEDCTDVDFAIRWVLFYDKKKKKKNCDTAGFGW